MTSLEDRIEEYKKKYRETHGKNMFFKKSQKIDCAKEISQEFSFNDMVRKTVFNIQGTNRVIFVYNIYKLYAHPGNFEQITDEIISIYDKILSQFPTIEVHVLLESFSVSAAERYKTAISSFCNRCMNSNTTYSQLITKVYIYHTPVMIDTIAMLLRPFIDRNIQERIVFFSKSESIERINKLFS